MCLTIGNDDDVILPIELSFRDQSLSRYNSLGKPSSHRSNIFGYQICLSVCLLVCQKSWKSQGCARVKLHFRDNQSIIIAIIDGWSANKNALQCGCSIAQKNVLFFLQEKNALHSHNTAGLRIIVRQHNDKNFR